ncbi:MAG: hypothetical protein GY851_31465 [bacterium]|nr:hypothetical protein [bacterium]
MFTLFTGILFCMGVSASDAASHPATITDEELFAALDLSRAGLEDVALAVEQKDHNAAARAWADYFRTRTRPTPHFDRDQWPDVMRRRFPQVIPPIMQAADKVARGEIGHPPFVLPVTDRTINWLHNPTKDTNYVSVIGSQWFMNPLGRAYLLTGDEKYAQTFAWVFDSWYDNQEAISAFKGGIDIEPIYRAYYPGIRLRILADNYYSMASSPALTPESHVKIMKQLLGAAEWLYAQNRQYAPGNQQVGAVVGLGVAGIVFPEFKRAETWTQCAETRMIEHLERDFFADGGHKELCTQYHKTCLRDMGYVLLTSEANGRPSPLRTPALERAYDWLGALIMPSGHTPALHSAAFSTDWAIHLLVGARFFDRPDFTRLASQWWRRGLVPNQKRPVSFANYMLCSLIEPPTDSPTPPSSGSASAHLAESGFAVMRTGWGASSRYLVLQYGWPESGHAYPGALSFCLMMNGELVATHPGSPLSYRHPAYAYCHSSRSHNIVTIDGASHTLAKSRAPGGILETLADLPGAWYVSARHEGYRDAFGAVCRRSILVIKDGPILVHDTIQGGSGHQAVWNLHTPLALRVNADRTASLAGNAAYRVCPARPDALTEAQTEERWMTVLPEGCQPDDCGMPVPVLRYTKPIRDDGAEYCVAIFEGDGHVDATPDGLVNLTAGADTYTVTYGDTKTKSLVVQAECVCVRHRDGKPDRAWVLNGSRLSVEGRVWLDDETPRSVELAPPR